MDASNDGSESVDQFLARIASLSSKQPPEDAERSKRAEEEMLQARKERQARRAERARSLSPSKTGPTPSLPPLRAGGDNAVSNPGGIEPPVALSPSSRTGALGRSNAISHSRTGSLSPSRTGSASPTRRAFDPTDVEFARPLPPPPSQDGAVSSTPAANAGGLSRSGTLSWQQRPAIRGTGSLSVRSRPQSTASIPDFSAPAQTNQEKTEEELSRKDIAASLGAKDPSWFRQTADRGLGFAAYRKNESENEPKPSYTGRGMKLPGMSQESNAPDPARDGGFSRSTSSLPPASPNSSQDRQPAVASEMSPGNRPSSVASLSSKSPTIDSPSLKPPEFAAPRLTDGSSLGRTGSILSSAGRPPSPTKGLGGFVESAMMKRSDSVSKRWSVQASQGLKRGDSVATARPPHLSGISGFTPGHSRNSSKDTRGVMEGNSSPLSSSRPVSSHGNDPALSLRSRPVQRSGDESPSSPGAQVLPEGDGTARSTAPERPSTPPESDSLLARSPSKTMDPRRWSPTKASWLESALNKPESPRFQPAKPEPPAWKLNMQRSKTEQSGQPAEADRPPSWKSSIAAKPLASPPLANTSEPPETRPEPKLPQPVTKVQEVDAAPTPLKKDEKPAVPSKRNVTPVNAGPTTKNGPASQASAIAGSENTVTRSIAKGNSGVDSKETKPPTAKPQPPQTPPKTDFRANLKPRQTAQTSNDGSEPEFKSVFGKLKRTTTQNYVAPDDLKDNIAKGKAALNVTGGPQRTKRVDEFKESILQKKEAMKASAASATKRDEPATPTETSNKPMPEAIARRMTLHKTGPSNEKEEGSKFAEANLPSQPKPMLKEAPEKPAPWKKSSTATAEASRALPQKPPTLTGGPTVAGQEKVSNLDSAPSKREETKSQAPTLENKETPKTPPKPAGVGKAPWISSAAAPKEKVDAPSWKSKEAQSAPKLSSSSSEAAAPQTMNPEPLFKGKGSENSKIAARLNPALAGLLSRGSSPRPQGETPSSSTPSTIEARPRRVDGGDDQASGELTHMTKGRAKGPKRRAPKSSAPPANETPKSQVDPVAKSSTPNRPAPLPKPSLPPSDRSSNSNAVNKPLPKPSLPPSDRSSNSNAVNKPLPRVPSSSLPLDKPATKSSDEVASTKEDASLAPIESASKPKPAVTTKSAELWKTSNVGAASKTVESGLTPKPVTPKKFDVAKDTPAMISSPPDSDGERKVGSQPVMPLTPSKSKLNTPKPPKPPVDNATKPGSTISSNKATGLGLQLGSASKKPSVAPELTPPPEPEVTSNKPKPSPLKPSSAKVIPVSKESSSSSSTLKVLEDFFGVLPNGREKLDFDTQAFLTSQNSGSEKIKTVSNQIWEVSGDGKRNPMPPQQEHILFEDCMYLTVHSKQVSNGSKSTDVYLWCGDEVPEAAIDDAQLFCRKIARENSAKLEVVKQGKESAEFFQSLGGIVITRRNKSSAVYMLCGRKHLGHVAFDEVDYSRSSLCSDYPFLVSARFGKFYLWKGASSSPEDVGCARLIGHDLGLTGEMEEVAEGEEPSGFWESFPPGSKQIANPRAKARQSARQSARLYRVEPERPKSSGGFWGLRAASPPKQSNKAQLEEVTPFSQRDLDVQHIHILDTYSEVYVVVGSMAKKPVEFVSAVHIAQEIAMLAPSIQDRSLLPSCHVLLGDPPQEVKTVFRKWAPSKTASPKEQLCVRVEEIIQDLGIAL